MAVARNSAPVHLRRIAQGVPPRDPQQLLVAAFTAIDYPDCIKNLTRWQIDPQAYVDGLDQIIDTLSPESDIYKRGLRALRKTCGIYGVLPASHLMPPGLTTVNKRPFASGGFADVWKTKDMHNQTFAVKRIRVYEVDNLENVKKGYCKEVVICRRMRHSNVLSVEGVAPELFELCMVSKWMARGNMLLYLKNGENVDRMRLLLGITRGLDYLHSNEVIHGDLKGPNILVDVQGNPLLADFGLSSITRNVTSVNASTPHSGGTLRWAAPELLDAISSTGQKQSHNAETDIYALSMVVIELFTGKVPYPDRMDANVIIMVTKGERPPQPVHAEALGLTPAIWKLTKRCWHKKPTKRPNTSEILAYLENKVVVAPPSFFKRLKGVFTR